MLDSNHIAYLSESIVTLTESIFVTSFRIFSFSQLISIRIFQNIFPNHLNNFKVALVCVFFLFNSAISTHINAIHRYPRVHYCLGPTNTLTLVSPKITHFSTKPKVAWSCPLFTFGIRKNEYHPWSCWKWHMNIHNSCTYTSFFVSMRFQLTNQIKSSYRILPHSAHFAASWGMPWDILLHPRYILTASSTIVYTLYQIVETNKRHAGVSDSTLLIPWLSFQENYSPVLTW